MHIPYTPKYSVAFFFLLIFFRSLFQCSLGDVHRFHSSGLPTHAVTVRVFLSFWLPLSFNASCLSYIFISSFFCYAFHQLDKLDSRHTRVQSMTKSLVFLPSFFFLHFFLLFLAIVYPVIRYPPPFLYLLSPSFARRPDSILASSSWMYIELHSPVHHLQRERADTIGFSLLEHTLCWRVGNDGGGAIPKG